MRDSRPTRKSRRIAAVLAALRGARHVAIVRLGSIGDVVASIPLAWFLRDLLGPGVKISWIAHSASAHLLHAVGAVDEVIEIPKGSLLSAVPTWKRILAGRELDVVLDVHGNLKSGVVSLLTGARTRVGFHRRDCREHWNPLFTNLKLPRLSSNNKTRRAMEIAELLGHPRPAPRFDLRFDPAETARAAQVLAAIDTESSPLAVLQLGRAEDVRSWPPESCAAFTQRLLDAGYSVLILGGPPEEDTGRQVRGLLAEAPPRLHFEINTLTLREVGALLSTITGTARERSVFVGGDSGCLHLAAGCGLRSIGLFGPQDPARTAPIGEHVEVLYHPEAAACIPCSRRECFHPTWSFCMKSITAHEVARQVIGSGATGSSTADYAGGESAAAATPGIAVARPGSPPTDVLPTLSSGERRGMIWTLLLATVLIALRMAYAGQLATAERFPGLGRLLETMGWIGPALSVLSGAGLVAATYLMGRRLGSPSTGLLAATLLPAEALFLDIARMSAAGGLFALFINLSLLLFLEGEVDSGGRRRWCGPLSVAAAFVAFLFQGILGILLPAFAVVIFRAGEKAMGELLRPRALITAALVAAGAALTFYVIGATSGDGLESPAVLFEPLTRATGSSDPIWTYARWLAVWCLPAAVLAPFALFAHLKNRRYREDLGFADRRWRYSKSVFLGGFVLLSLLPMKSPAYLIALLPSLSVLSAAWLEKRWEEWTGSAGGGPRVERVARLAMLALALIFAAFVLVGSVRSRGAEPWILAALFAAGWVLAARIPAGTTLGLSLRLGLVAVVVAAAS